MSFKEKFNSFTKSRGFKNLLISLLSLVIAIFIFHAGMIVGYHKAGFSYRMGDNYLRTMEGPGRGMMGDMFRKDFSPAHGAVGKIVSVQFPTFVVLGPDNVEKVVRISSSTQIRKFRDVASTTDLAVDDAVVVLGSPNDTSEIEAKLIRIMPVAPNPVNPSVNPAR